MGFVIIVWRVTFIEVKLSKRRSVCVEFKYLVVNTPFMASLFTIATDIERLQLNSVNLSLISFFSLVKFCFHSGAAVWRFYYIFPTASTLHLCKSSECTQKVHVSHFNNFTLLFASK